MGRSLCPAGRALEDWLHSADIERGEFADLIGTSRVSLWRWMTGEYAPTVDSAARIELWTGIPSRAWASHPELRAGVVSEVAAA